MADAAREVREADRRGAGGIRHYGRRHGHAGRGPRLGVFDEVQPGSFCVMDLQYGSIEHEIVLRRRRSVTTVLSRPAPIDASSTPALKPHLVRGAHGKVIGRTGRRRRARYFGSRAGDDVTVGASCATRALDPGEFHDRGVVHRGGVVEVLAVDAGERGVCLLRAVVPVGGCLARGEVSLRRASIVARSGQARFWLGCGPPIQAQAQASSAQAQAFTSRVAQPAMPPGPPVRLWTDQGLLVSYRTLSGLWNAL